MARTTAYRLRRAGVMTDNPSTFTNGANAFASAFDQRTHATLLVKRSDQGLEGFLLSPEGSDRDAQTLANVLSAKVEEVDLPSLDTESVGHLILQRKGATARETQAGIDPKNLSALLPSILSQRGSWVSVTFRRSTNQELRRQRAWLDNRMGTGSPTHHTSGMSPLVITVIAGSNDKATTRSILEQMASAMPGFDLTVRPATPTPVTAAIPALGVAVAFSVIAGGLFAMTGSLFAAKYLSPIILIALAVALAKSRGWLPAKWLRLWRANTHTEFDKPGRWRGLRYKKPRSAVTIPGKEKAGRDGDYPFAKNTFLVGASVIVGLVAPTAGALSGEKTAKSGAVPPALLDRVGPYIGQTTDGPAFLSADDQKYGVSIIGRAGSGKTLLLRALFGWSMVDKVNPDPTKGFPGKNNTLITFESKGDGVPAYRAWSEATGDPLIVVDFNSHDAYAIDMFDIPGSFADRAAFFVNAMVYAFEPGAIMDKSFTTLVNVFAAALAVDSDVLDLLAEPLDPDSGPMHFAYVMLGGLGDGANVELMSALIARANDLARLRPQYAEAINSGAYTDPDAEAAARTYVAKIDNFIGAAYGIRQYAELTPSARRGFTEAPVTKVAPLLGGAGKSWWSASRRKVGWSTVLNSHQSVIINTGTSENGETVTERLGQQLSSMLMYTLKDSIARTCSGWEAQGRSVSIFSDELSLLAGNSPEVIAWLRDQGRSFGVRPFMATQRPAQLPDQVRRAFLNFATLISFSQDEPATAQEVADNVSDGDDWTAADILHLPPYTAIVRAGFEFRRQTAFTVLVGNFEADRSTFAETQGYTEPQALAPTFSPVPVPPPAPVNLAPVNLVPVAEADRVNQQPVDVEPRRPSPFADSNIADLPTGNTANRDANVGDEGYPSLSDDLFGSDS